MNARFIIVSILNFRQETTSGSTSASPKKQAEAEKKTTGRALDAKGSTDQLLSNFLVIFFFFLLLRKQSQANFDSIFFLVFFQMISSWGNFITTLAFTTSRRWAPTSRATSQNSEILIRITHFRAEKNFEKYLEIVRLFKKRSFN